MNKGYRIEQGALHFDGRVRALHAEFVAGCDPTHLIAITDDGVISVPWHEIPLMPCPTVLFLEPGGDDANLQ